jgi:hypothetical protein
MSSQSHQNSPILKPKTKNQNLFLRKFDILTYKHEKPCKILCQSFKPKKNYRNQVTSLGDLVSIIYKTIKYPKWLGKGGEVH